MLRRSVSPSGGHGVVSIAMAAVVFASGMATAAVAQASRPLSDSAFGALVTRTSEPGGYFDTDNLISNESSFLHPLPLLRRIGVSGGTYIGVGPDQNYSYIAAIRPRIAFIVDIRRDNLLEHLLFKAIIGRSANRHEYLAQLFGRRLPSDTTGWGRRSIGDLLDVITASPADPAAAARIRSAATSLSARTGLRLTEADIATIARFHETFIAAGPSLRFNTHGRAPQADYPDFRRLAAERDTDGVQASYLATEERFRVVKALHDANLIVPVVGDFAGGQAFRRIAEWMREHDEPLSALYASNVEQYLFRDGTFDAFAANVARLPRAQTSVIIRSCFTCRGGHPAAVPGYNSVQLVQLASRFVSMHAARELTSYGQLVMNAFERR